MYPLATWHTLGDMAVVVESPELLTVPPLQLVRAKETEHAGEMQHATNMVCGPSQ